MGVPGFFKWLIDNKRIMRNNNLIKSVLDSKQVKYLMLDTNCLLHPCVNYIKDKYIAGKIKFDEKSKISIRLQIEDKIWNIIEKRINDMIEEVKPELIYIAIDGVAPMAKILQQRQRRHRYLYDSKIKYTEDNSILKKQDIDIQENGIHVSTFPISSIELTPGTDYMERIHEKIIKYVNHLKIKNIYSSYHTEGEGEHKILKYIKEKITKGDKIIIYGLDADLLFLSLSAGEEHDIYVMREKPFFTNNDFDMEEKVDYNYVEIKQLHSIINSLGIPTKDFILLCYLIGNDFIPGILTLDIKKHGLDKILSAYEETKKKLNLQNFNLVIHNPNDKTHENGRHQVNYDILYEILNTLTYTENNLWNNINRKRDDDRRNLLNSNHESNQEKANTDKKENTKEINKLNKFISGESVPLDIFDRIEFNNSVEYYNHFLGTNEIRTNKTTIEKMVDSYIEGFQWYISYYLDECISWSWGYNYMITPLLKDIVRCFPQNSSDIKPITRRERELCPMEQLILALPIDCYKYVIEKELYEKLSKSLHIGYMFPKSFEIDINKELFLWKCAVKIPMVNYEDYIFEIKIIFKTIKNIKNEIQTEIYNL